MGDLCLYDNENLVIDPIANRPIYNPINKWNCGTHADEYQGGAIHLTSPPNTLDAEIFLGAAATIQRKYSATGEPIFDMNDLICASLYGRKDRNSDPRIGWIVNQIVRDKNAKVTLADPVGLYGQMPDFSAFEMPSWTNKTIKDCFEIIRGKDIIEGYEELNNMILHMRFILPEDADFKFSDIKVNNLPIKWGSQIAETIKVQLSANALVDSDKPSKCYPVYEKNDDKKLKQIQHLIPLEVYAAYINNKINVNSAIRCTPLMLQRGKKVENLIVVPDSINEEAIFIITRDGKEIKGVDIKLQDYKSIEDRVNPNIDEEIRKKKYLHISIDVDDNISTGPIEIKIKQNVDIPYTQYGLIEIIHN